MNIDNCKFLFYLTGKCFLSKETNAKYLYVKHFKNMLCCQGWDKNTPYLNASKRKTFSLPVGQYVSAFNYYNTENPTNPHTPTLVLKIEGNSTIVTVEEVMIKANTEGDQQLVIKINDNYETHTTKQNLGLDGNSMKLEDIENNSNMETANVMCELMFSSMSYKYLNRDQYLSNLEIPFTKKDLDERYNVFGGLFSNSGNNHINLNYLLEDTCQITREADGDYILTINKNLCGFQLWHERSAELNKSITRHVFNLLPTQFQSIMHQHTDIIERMGFEQVELGFQPTCLITIEGKLYIGVIKGINIDHSFQGFNSNENTSYNKIRISTVQTSGNVGGTKNNISLKQNEIPTGERAVSMYIDGGDVALQISQSTALSNNELSNTLPIENLQQLQDLIDELRKEEISNSGDYLTASQWVTLLLMACLVSPETQGPLYKKYLSDMIGCLYSEGYDDSCQPNLPSLQTEDSNNNNTINQGISVFKDKFVLGNLIALDNGLRLVNLLEGKGNTKISSFIKSVSQPLNKAWSSFLKDKKLEDILGNLGNNIDVSLLDVVVKANIFTSEVMQLLDTNRELQNALKMAKDIATSELNIDEEVDSNQFSKTVISNVDKEVLKNFTANAIIIAKEIEADSNITKMLSDDTNQVLKNYIILGNRIQNTVSESNHDITFEQALVGFKELLSVLSKQ